MMVNVHSLYTGGFLRPRASLIQCRQNVFLINMYTVNIFVHIHFRRFMKMGNFACIKIYVLSIIGYFCYNKSNFPGVHISADI